jgi:hypothetical protein
MSRNAQSKQYVFNSTRQSFLATEVRLANTYWTRLVGLLGTETRDFAAGSALWIVPCRGIHTCAMRFPIDVIYLDRANRVVHLEESVRPWRLMPVRTHAHTVLELPAHTIFRTATSIGDELEIGIMGSLLELGSRSLHRAAKPLNTTAVPLSPQLLLAWEPRWRNFISCLKPALSRSYRRALAGTDPNTPLLVHWQPKWPAFLSSIWPALRPSEPPVALECRTGYRPNRTAVASFLLNAAALATIALVLRDSRRAPAPADTGAASNYSAVYYFGTLPRMKDATGANPGGGLPAGGTHSTVQTIRVLRGDAVAKAIAEMRKLDLEAASHAGNLVIVPVQKVVEAQLDATSEVTTPPAAPHALQLPPELAEKAETLPPHKEQANAESPVMPMVVAAAPDASSVLASRLSLPIEVAGPAPNVTALALSMRVPKSLPIALAPVSAPSTAVIHSAPAPESAKLVKAGIFAGMAAVITAAPGTELANAEDASSGALGLSPSGKLARGEGGRGIAASGGATAGNGSGAGGRTAGISPGPGPGGVGGASGPNAIRGLSISGGVITLPSFGDPKTSATSAGGSGTHGDSRDEYHGTAITIVSTSRSGGALNAYGVLKGSRVYTIYIDTPQGMATMEFSALDGALSVDDLTPPEVIASDLSPALPAKKLIVACTLDRTGNVRQARILQGGGYEYEKQLLADLRGWRFRPARRAGEAVEVEALLGFHVGTQ